MMPILELKKLTVTERLELIGELWDSIEAEEQPELSKEQLIELDKRLASYEKDGNKGKPWSEIKAKLKQQ
jgi:putative addiction module component (TIGR02574 family)